MDGQCIRSKLIVFHATLGTYVLTWKMKPSDSLRVFNTEQISTDMIYACGLSQHYRQERAFHGCACAPLLQAHTLAMMLEYLSVNEHWN